MDIPIELQKNWKTNQVPIKPEHLMVPRIANPHFFRPKHTLVVLGSKDYIAKHHPMHLFWAGCWYFEQVNKFKLVKRCTVPQGFLGRKEK
jgi:hypothetical protein